LYQQLVLSGCTFGHHPPLFAFLVPNPSKKHEKEKYQVDQRQRLLNIKEELYDIKKKNEEADDIEKLDVDDFFIE